MRKILIFITITVLSLTSCNLTNDEQDNPRVIAENIQDEIIDCFVNKDAEKLKGIFCSYIQNNHSRLDEEIQEAFNLLDGEIISYDEPYTHLTAATTDESGWVLREYGAKTNNIVTDKGTKYYIMFKGWVVNRNDSSKEGVMFVDICSDTLKEELKVKENTPYPNVSGYLREIGSWGKPSSS